MTVITLKYIVFFDTGEIPYAWAFFILSASIIDDFKALRIFNYEMNPKKIQGA